MSAHVRLSVAFTIFIVPWLATGLDDQQVAKPAVDQVNPRPSPARLLPDVVVTSPKFTLVSTELGKPGVEFPKDTVRFTATLKNSGLAPCPEGGSYYIQLTRNGVLVANSGATNLLGGVGSTYGYSWIDTIVHGQAKELTYKITVTPSFNEVRSDNNVATCTGYEGFLHGYGGADFGITKFTSSFVNGPAGRTFYFAVTVKNNSLTYPTIGSSAYIYVDTGEHKHIAMLYTGQAGLGLPDPLEGKTYTLGRKDSEMPAGNFWVRAVLEIQQDYDPVMSNNTSAQTVLVRNTR